MRRRTFSRIVSEFESDSLLSHCAHPAGLGSRESSGCESAGPAVVAAGVIRRQLRVGLSAARRMCPSPESDATGREPRRRPEETVRTDRHWSAGVSCYRYCQSLVLGQQAPDAIDCQSLVTGQQASGAIDCQLLVTGQQVTIVTNYPWPAGVRCDTPSLVNSLPPAARRSGPFMARGVYWLIISNFSVSSNSDPTSIEGW